MGGWIGVDLDGTLAEYNGWKGADVIGEPVPKMLDRVKTWLIQNQDVRIFTARVSSNNPNARESAIAINAWCLKYIGRLLPITSEKDYGMIELWDDRCKQVIPNTGIALEELIKQGKGL